MAAEKETLRQQWLVQFQKAQQLDSWGQVLEAQEEYTNVAGQMAAKQNLHCITSTEKNTMHRLSLCLSARVQAMQNLEDVISSLDMKELVPVFEKLFTGAESDDFPVDPAKYSHARPVQPTTDGEIICGDADEPNSDWHQHHTVLKNVAGTVVSLRIDKIGLKDAQEYIDPFITVIVADTRTNILDTHDTPHAKERRATHVMFDHQVYLNISLEDMSRQQAALFFEFKHYKPKKKKVSTRCWAFMELSELKVDEEIVLEIYHKPTDLRKKKIKLHSEKPLYLHLFASFVKA